MRAWQHSNPIDYADWFNRTMAEEFAQLRQLKLAEMAAGDVEEYQTGQSRRPCNVPCRRSSGIVTFGSRIVRS